MVLMVQDTLCLGTEHSRRRPEVLLFSHRCFSHCTHLTMERDYVVRTIQTN